MNLNKKTVKDFIYTATLFFSSLFFSTIAILGISYTGSADSSLYKNISVIVSVISIFIFVMDFFASPKAPIRFYLSLTILLIFAFIGLAGNYTSSPMYRQFIVFSFPSALIGIYYARKRTIAPMVKWLDLVMLILSVSFIFTVPRLFYRIQEQQVNYSQMMSYYAAFTALLNLFLIQYGARYKRFAFFNTNFYKYFCLIIFPFQVLTIFMGGGRGAVVTFAVGILVNMMQYKSGKLIRNLIIIILLLIGSTYVIFSFLDSSSLEVFVKNAERSFSFTDTSLSIYDRTSGRNYVYQQSLHAIFNHPILGYGLFNYVEQIKPQPYPHNLFMEWALQGGIVYTAICTILIIGMLSKQYKIQKQNSSLILMYPLIVYPFTELLFSGSYMQTSLFWFIIMFTYNYEQSHSSIIKNPK